MVRHFAAAQQERPQSMNPFFPPFNPLFCACTFFPSQFLAISCHTPNLETSRQSSCALFPFLSTLSPLPSTNPCFVPHHNDLPKMMSQRSTRAAQVSLSLALLPFTCKGLISTAFSTAFSTAISMAFCFLLVNRACGLSNCFHYSSTALRFLFRIDVVPGGGSFCL